MAAEHIASLTLSEAHRVLTEISSLSTSLQRLVEESVQAVISERGGATTLPSESTPPPPVAPPLETGVVLGKDKASWAELTSEEQSAAQQLGFDEAGWDAGECPPTCSNEWRHLTSFEREAATALGYTPQAWDLEATGEEPAEASDSPQAAPVVAAPQQAIAAPAPPIPQLVGADGRSAVEKFWGEMTFEEQNNAMLLGYDESMWDNGEWPTTVQHPWIELSSTEQEAAQVLGYTQAKWDSELETPENEASMNPPHQLTATSIPASAQVVAPRPTGASPEASWATAGGRRGNARPPPGQQPLEVTRTVAPRAPPSNHVDLTSFNSGMMFGCKRDTYDENMSRHLFGLPESHWKTANKITDRTLLFLFNYSTRQLHGVYVRDGPPAMNIEPQAWAHHRQVGANSMSSPYPAQVRWRELRACRAIREELWTQVPTRKGSSGKGGKPHYDMWMTGAQAQVLAELCIRHG